MKSYLLVLSCLLTLQSQAQRGTEIRHSDVNQEQRAAEDVRREIKREELETHKIVVRYERDALGNFKFICENKTFCIYTVEVSFPELINLEADMPLPAIVSVPPGTRSIFTLRKTRQGSPHLRYHYHTYKGCQDPKVDTAFAYLLPVAPGKETRIFELSYIGTKYGGESQPKGWYAVGLDMHAGDTVFAARRGRVTMTNDQANLTDSGYTYSQDENFVEIAHSDCTFGKYTVFKDSGIFVQPGDWVEAGQPLGIVGGERYAEGPHLRFSVRYHLDQDVLDKDGQATDRTHHWAYVPVNFWIKDKGKIHLASKTLYTSEHPAELVTQEMTKKDARKWKETHKSS
jgi:murein DD-endopeptidase MepM/ murein hydrolase activator NlpD